MNRKNGRIWLHSARADSELGPSACRRAHGDQRPGITFAAPNTAPRAPAADRVVQQRVQSDVDGEAGDAGPLDQVAHQLGAAGTVLDRC